MTMMSNDGFSRFNKMYSYQFVLVFIAMWFYCTLSCMTTAIESKDFEATARTNIASNIPHSRRKRFLAFPLGSSFATSVCLTVGVLGNPNYQYLSFGLNWGLAYDLPNATWILQHANGGIVKNNDDDSSNGTDSPMPSDDVTPMPALTDKPDDSDANTSEAEAEKNIQMIQMPMLKRRERRDLYGKIETLIDRNVELNVDVDNFEIGRAADKRTQKHEIVNDARLLQRTLLLNRPVVKRKRWIRDLLATTAKNPTELTTTKTTSSTEEATTTMSKIMPTASSLSNGTQNNSFIIRKLSASSSTASVTKSISGNNSDSLQQPLQPQPSKPCEQQYCKETRILSRSKRFLTFPEGSSFSVAVCITVGVIGNPTYSYLAYGLNWGVAYDLPNASWVINHLHGFSRHPVPATILRRRTRSALYKEIEAVVDNMGYSGRDCVLRALCESRQYFRKNKLSMVGEMLRIIFSLPKQRLFTRELHENSGIELYDHAFRRKRDVDCSEEYDCSFSLLELAFGKYSSPPPGYYS